MRLYNGCPDDDLRELLERQTEFASKLKQYNGRCVYFPYECTYIVFIDNRGVWSTESKTLIESVNKFLIGVEHGKANHL